MTSIPICAECAHYLYTRCGPDPHKCVRRTRFDPVEGVVTDYRFCRSERREGWFGLGNRCGPDGRFFEQEPPLRSPIATPPYSSAGRPSR
jgi:hypothetical protein